MTHIWKDKNSYVQKNWREKQFQNVIKLIKFRLGLKYTKQNKTPLLLQFCSFFSQLFYLDILKVTIIKFFS